MTKDTALTSRWTSLRTKARALRVRQATPPATSIDTSPAPKPHAVAKERANRPDAAPRLARHGRFGKFRESYQRQCRVQAKFGRYRRQKRKVANPMSTRPQKPAASSGEPVKLHKTGAIKNEQDASFYANLVHLFGASFGNETSKRGATAET